MTPHSAEAPRGANAGKRERILDAAERVFARRGFYNARVSEVAQAAGVADGTIYLYFRSKDDLLISLFESRMERVNKGLAGAIAGEKTAPKKLAAFVAAYFAMIHENPVVAEVLTIELRQSSKFMKAYPNPRFGDFLRLLAGIVAEGQDRGELENDVPAQFCARAIFGIIDELALTWLLSGKGKFDIDRAGDWVAAIILRGLKRRKS